MRVERKWEMESRVIYHNRETHFEYILNREKMNAKRKKKKKNPASCIVCTSHFVGDLIREEYFMRHCHVLPSRSILFYDAFRIFKKVKQGESERARARRLRGCGSRRYFAGITRPQPPALPPSISSRPLLQRLTHLSLLLPSSLSEDALLFVPALPLGNPLLALFCPC